MKVKVNRDRETASTSRCSKLKKQKETKVSEEEKTFFCISEYGGIYLE